MIKNLFLAQLIFIFALSLHAQRKKDAAPETTEEEILNSTNRDVEEEDDNVDTAEEEAAVPVEVESIEPEYVVPPDESKPTVVESDIKRGSDGEPTESYRLVPFYYPQKPKLQGKTRKGAYIYNTEKSPQKEGASFRIGPFAPTNLKGDTEGITYETIYGESTSVLIGVDYEYQLTKTIGKLALRPGVAFATASGNGRFKIDTTRVAEEIVTLYVLDFTLDAMYRAQFAEGQILVPYGGAGLDYFGFTEYRSDKDGADAFKFGGAPAFHWLAGLQLQLDFLDREGLWQIDSEYGINHMYLYGGIRYTIGLSNRFDFTNVMGEGGVFIEF